VPRIKQIHNIITEIGKIKKPFLKEKAENACASRLLLTPVLAGRQLTKHGGIDNPVAAAVAVI
jgi:hypothetical protein